MANKNQLLRYILIDKMLRNQHYPSKQHILDKINEELDMDHSESVLEKDFHAMRYSFQAPIAYHKRERGYFYGIAEKSKSGVMSYEHVKDYNFMTISLSKKNLLMLNMAVSVLEGFKDIGILEGFGDVVDKVLDIAHIGQELNRDTKKHGIVQLDKPFYVKGKEHLSLLINAIQNGKKVSFDYQKFSDIIPSKRRVHPYLLKEFKGRWYLVSYEEKDSMIKNFGVDRMSNIKVLDQEGIPPEEVDFDPNSYFDHCYGVTKKEKIPEHIILSFSKFFIDYIKTQPIHKSQKVLKENEEEYEISLDLIINPELISLLLSFGDNLKIISPPRLVDSVKKELRKSLDKYN